MKRVLSVFVAALLLSCLVGCKTELAEYMSVHTGALHDREFTFKIENNVYARAAQIAGLYT